MWSFFVVFRKPLARRGMIIVVVVFNAILECDYG